MNMETYILYTTSALSVALTLTIRMIQDDIRLLKKALDIQSKTIGIQDETMKLLVKSNRALAGKMSETNDKE